MAATIPNSETAVQMSVLVVRAFVTLRQSLQHVSELKEKLTRVEGWLDDHDQSIKELVAALKQLFKDSPVPKTRRIGFSLPESDV